jgi:hypothetical protein
MKSNDKKNQVTTRKPDEVGGIYFSSGIKIFDPKTGEIILQKRGDD